VAVRLTAPSKRGMDLSFGDSHEGCRVKGSLVFAPLLKSDGA
jgi:hypothetical protein